MTYKPGSVAIAYCYSREVDGAFATCLASLAFDRECYERIWAPDGGGAIYTSRGSIIHSQRNELVRHFLDGDAEWMWMIDTDHTFGPHTLKGLLAVADPVHVPVVGALCFAGGRGAGITPTMYRFHERKPEDPPGAVLGVISRWPEGELVEVHATGAACLLVHRSVLELVGNAFESQSPWQWFGVGIHDGVEFGEDVVFCQRVRQAGIRVFVNTAVEAPHHKSWIIDSNDYRRFLDEWSSTPGEVLEARLKAKHEGRVTRS